MGANACPCGTSEVTDADEVFFNFLDHLLHAAAQKVFPPIPLSSFAYHDGRVWLPDGGGVLC